MNPNLYSVNFDDLNNNLNVLSLTVPQNATLNKENYKDIFDLKKKIILQSSSLLHNERRMINLANAMNKNKNTFRNSSINRNNNNNNGGSNSNIFKEIEINKSTSRTNINNEINMINININNSKRGNKQLNSNRLEKKIFFGNNEEITKKGKYPEPDDIDMNLVNVKNENISKNSKTYRNNIIKFEKDSARKTNDFSNENLYFINNNKNNNTSIFNNNYYNKSNSTSIIKDIQNNNNFINNNNTFLDKTNSNYLINNNSNINNDITNIDNTSIGEQISYLENNIMKFEQNFGQ